MARNSVSILFVDAYDSFTQNIAALLRQELEARITLIKIDTNIEQEYDLPLDDFVAKISAIVLGPGPGDPRVVGDAGNYWAIIESAARLRVPILGICLGFQALCVQYGLHVECMTRPCHGHTKRIVPVRQEEDNIKRFDIFENTDHDNIWATCYNSLCVRADDKFIVPDSSRPTSSSANSTFSCVSSQDDVADLATSKAEFPCLKLLAKDEDGNAMAFVHYELPFWGVQFHPESCKSNMTCHQIIRNWIIAVNKHNSKIRPYSKFATLPNARALEKPNFSLKPNTQKWSADRIQSILEETTQSTSKGVNWRSTKLTCTQRDISEIVNNACQDGKIAMLESTKKGRFSIYAITGGILKADIEEPVSLLVNYKDPMINITSSHEGHESSIIATTTREDIMKALEGFMISTRATGGASEIPFWGGFIGFMSYENGLEAIEVNTSDQIGGVDDMSLLWVTRSLVFDNETSTLYVQSIKNNDDSFIDGMIKWFETDRFKQSQQVSAPEQRKRRVALASARVSAKYSLPNRDEYGDQFDSCQAHLHRGNSYELCLTTEAQVEMTTADGDGDRYVFELYKNLHHHNPVPFGAYLKFPHVTILSTSPEQYMKWDRTGTIDMVPMKGTVPRNADMTLEKATAILSSSKEQAENLMIADLIRHDLYSTVGYTSKVEVIKLCEVVEHETVYQLVSHIRAHPPISPSLPTDLRQQEAIHYGFAALRTTLPPGSMTGAPKKRSCELLQEIERRNRGVYSGVLGYLDVGGGGSWSVCIRTAFRVKDEQQHNKNDKTRTDIWRIGAGGAITVLSSKEGEWEEMKVKLSSVLRGFTDE